jgi:hypothetical protein
MELEPKLKSSIIVRPAYNYNMEIYKTNDDARFVGELYVNNKKIYTTSDRDTESSAFVDVAKYIQRYHNKYKSNIFIDANMSKLKG